VEEHDEFEDSSGSDESTTKPLARTLFKPKGISSKITFKATRVSQDQTIEDLFWEGALIPKQSPKGKKPKVSSTIGSAPVSPPPSRSRQVGPRFQTPPPREERLLSTTLSSGDGPAAAVVEKDDDEGPVRDSPNNLFLSDSKASHPLIPVPDEQEEYEEPPTVSYVFRGKRQEFPNPLYNLPAEVHEKSKLPPEHPDFSPSPSIKPKRLFAEELAKKGKKSKRRRSPSPSSPSPSIPSRPKRNPSPKRKATTIKKQRAIVPAAS